MRLTKGSTVREATGHLWLLKMFQKISFQQNPVALFLALEITLSGFCGAQNCKLHFLLNECISACNQYISHTLTKALQSFDGHNLSVSEF
ncbi:hypothetical protein chiPu_0014611 [Chiloscyllium punctatum]|uniref:Uncharacterized protein n=1 Tax=Chiloscyllium punctatum TaxID=137246 RepID=A0A401T0D7_CHIPU|nr:hypothetical protein [Chiloscyllium punctatum]